jgi:membrane protein required for colicin V production
VPAKSQPNWATEAKSRFVLQGTGEWLVSMSPDLEALWAKYKRQRGNETDPPEAPAPGNRSSLDRPSGGTPFAELQGKPR